MTASGDTAPEVASAAVMQLGQLGSAPALDRLAQLTSASDAPVARQALQSLASAAPERAAGIVDTLIGQGTSGLQTALASVSSLPTEAGQRVLQHALRSAQGEVVSEALSQLDTGTADVGEFAGALERISHDVHVPNDLRERARTLLLSQSVESESLPEAQF